MLNNNNNNNARSISISIHFVIEFSTSFSVSGCVLCARFGFFSLFFYSLFTTIKLKFDLFIYLGFQVTCSNDLLCMPTLQNQPASRHSRISLKKKHVGKVIAKRKETSDFMFNNGKHFSLYSTIIIRNKIELQFKIQLIQFYISFSSIFRLFHSIPSNGEQCSLNIKR